MTIGVLPAWPGRTRAAVTEPGRNAGFSAFGGTDRPWRRALAAATGARAGREPAPPVAVAAASSLDPATRTLRDAGLVRLGDLILWFGVFLGSVVMIEPAPYDLIVTLQAVAALSLGMVLPRAIGPLIVLLLLYNIGGLVALTQVVYWQENPPMFVAVSFFLMVSSIFFAATIANHPHRLKLIVNATVWSAVIAAIIGIVGYKLQIEWLMRASRAKAMFKDPNVYGPFLVLPLVVLCRRMLTEHGRRALVAGALMMPILIAVLLSFSRATWGLAAGCLIGIWLVVLADAGHSRERLRLVGLAFAGVVALAIMFAIALSDETVREMLFERAKLVQSYDGARLGRFARHLIGFEWATRLPLGLGPYQFDHYLPEDPHNVFLKSFITYGWLGGVAYPVLAFWTIGKLTRHMFRDRPWKVEAQCVWITLTGHQIMSWIIDSDHWRHFFLLWGLAWGMIALEAQWRRSATAPGPIGDRDAEPVAAPRPMAGDPILAALAPR